MQNFAKRLQALEARKPATSDDWRDRLAKYRKWFEDGEDLGHQTDEEKANLARYKQYFDDL